MSAYEARGANIRRETHDAIYISLEGTGGTCLVLRMDLPPDWQHDYLYPCRIAIVTLARGLANYLVLTCTNKGRVQKWFNEANGNRFLPCCSSCTPT